MNETGHWQDELTSLGLTGYESRVYLALLGRDRYTAAQLARESGVPRQRIYDVLASLTQRGLVRPLEGKVVCYTAVDPTTAMERLMAAHRASLNRLEATSVALVESLVPLWSHGRKETDPLDYVEIIRDHQVLVERFEELQASAEREILSVAKSPYLITGNPAGKYAAARLTKIGGALRAIYERPALNTPELVAEVRAYRTAGEQVRVAECVPMRMLIADGTHVLMSLRDPVAGGGSMTNLLIEHPALAQCLTFAFETIWAGASELEDAMAEDLTTT